MKVKVVPLLNMMGKPRPREEVRNWPALSGELTIAPVPPDGPKRFSRVAQLRNLDHRGREPYCGPLYDPQLEKMTDKGFLLRGHVVVPVREGELNFYMQEWWVRPLDSFEESGLTSRR
jgi:hypothetical protein